MPHYVIDQLAAVVDRCKGIGLSSAKILIIGAAYKKDVDDTRESPALVIIDLLKSRGTAVDYHDPYAPVIPLTRAHASLAGMRSRSIKPECVSQYDAVLNDAVLIVTDHSVIDWQSLVDAAQLVVDTRNATRDVIGAKARFLSHSVISPPCLGYRAIALPLGFG
jgi:UDP-N-acetyl-D-glucosamine dehydrogenase